MRMNWIAIACISWLAACRGQADDRGRATPAHAAPGDAAARPVPDAAVATTQTPPARIEPWDTRGEDEKIALHTLGAVPAWEAVVRRGDFLARRGRSGAVYGTVHETVDTIAPDQPEPAPYRWLIDDTEGAGSLGIRLAPPPGVSPDVGRRALAWGAWHVDEQKRWYWQAQRMAYLEPHKSPAAALPGHVTPGIAEVPAGALPVSQTADKPAEIVFAVVQRPAHPNDGWQIADKRGDKPVALLFLPGERDSYGDQDYRTADECWNLERGARYVVRIKRPGPGKPDELPRLTAAEAPRRLDK